jgi:preprotein translocase subunit SecY
MKDLRKKLLYSAFVLLVVLVGCQVPIPGLDNAAISDYFENSLGDSFSLINSFTGGSFENMSIFALNVTPYITASIIMQLLTIAIPALEEMHRDGEEGRKKMTEITRYVTVGLALLEGLGIAIGFGRGGYMNDYNALNVALMVLCLAAGGVFVMWLGECITEKGIGNGISIILLVNIISRMPSDFYSLYQKFMQGKAIGDMLIAGLIIAIVVVGTVILVSLFNSAERRIPVQYAKKMAGRKLVGGQSSFIPVKVMSANVIPVIFAGSLMSFPSVISSLFSVSETGFWGKVLKVLSQSSWCDPSHPARSIGLIVYIILIFLFAYFYTSITFNPIEVANNMKKSGGFVPGIRPGKPTSDYLNKIMNYVIFIGAVGLSVVAIIPIFFSGVFNANVSFGGTSIIIVVGVILETNKQIESQMLVRHYKGFLNS